MNPEFTVMKDEFWVDIYKDHVMFYGEKLSQDCTLTWAEIFQLYSDHHKTT